MSGSREGTNGQERERERRKRGAAKEEGERQLGGLDGGGSTFRWSECERERRDDEESGISTTTEGVGEGEKERTGGVFRA